MTMNPMIKRAINVLTVVIILAMVGTLVASIGKKAREAGKVRQASVCPALLSISRSARDTLIVMKAEPLCNYYVLDNLK